METNHIRDQITIEGEDGQEKVFNVEALFDMDEQSYALLSSQEELLLMRIEDEGEEQYLVGIDDPEERDAVLAAYEVAIEEEEADGSIHH